jgi:MFS superfamily sulfate permease-like transporter
MISMKYLQKIKQHWHILLDLYLGPYRQQFTGYDWRDLCVDLGFGLWNAFLIIPGAIAFSGLARLPPIAGIASSVYPAILYFLTGSSKSISAGTEGFRQMNDEAEKLMKCNHQ